MAHQHEGVGGCVQGLPSFCQTTSGEAHFDKIRQHDSVLCKQPRGNEVPVTVYSSVEIPPMGERRKNEFQSGTNSGQTEPAHGRGGCTSNFLQIARTDSFQCFAQGHWKRGHSRLML